MKPRIFKRNGIPVCVFSCGDEWDCCGCHPRIANAKVFSKERAKELLEIEQRYKHEAEEMKKFKQGFAYKKGSR